ncbi:hypothetical protein PV325_002848 [Microctonus aethiopoides]|nr:hypothetical protein PV325_002848 [Microctonus aethiopoides]
MLDIRSYFNLSGSKKPTKNANSTITKKRQAISSSDEEDSNKSITKLKEPVKKPSARKGTTRALSDSDDETIHKRSKSITKSLVKKTEKSLKPISIDSIFGNKPINRGDTLPVPKKLQDEEASIHDDDDFEATLRQVDMSEIDAMCSADTTETQTTGKRKNNSSDADTLPKKLKLDSNEEIENKNADQSKTLNITKLIISQKNKPKLDIVIEKKPEKRKMSHNDEKAELIEEHIAKKKQHIEAYQAYLHRGGARNPGSKPIPNGSENCLAGLSFVVTGVMDSLEREELDELIEKYGGRVIKAVSKKTDYLVVGEPAGESKLAKARSYNIKQISEDELLDMIRTRPAKNSSKIIHSRSKKKKLSPPITLVKPESEESSPPIQKSSEKVELKPTKLVKSPESNIDQSPEEIKHKIAEKKITTPPESNVEIKSSTIQKIDNKTTKNDSVRVSYIGEAQALVEKYRPKSMKQIIGQHGDKSVAKKFYTWLQNWHKNQNSKVKPTKPSPWAKNDDGSFFKACLLSGPPGVGKTTTTQVVCSELGYDLLEFNASDTRSKRLLKEEISSLLSNTTVKGFYSINSQSKTSSKPVLLMDEVDGMAGNEDRGGLQELISLIKSTEIPIVCICNDRNNPKMRTLSNYTFDLRFQKPRIEQIRGAMKSLCCKENITITTENLDQLIISTNQDIRQVINHLAMLVSGSQNNDEKNDKRVNKDLKIGPWDVVRKVFSAEEHKTMSIHDKSDLFFHDYNIAGLFVQENYLTVVPKCPKNEILQRIADSAESLAMGDLVEKSIRNNGSWSMLPIQACYSSVIPGSLMSGYIGGQINFPSWLGRNSKKGKFDRLLQEITVHTRLVTGASKEAINIDYLKPLRDAILRPLVTEGSEGVAKAINTMNHYHLLRDDLDALVEVSLWPGERDPLQSVDSKVKAAFTRAYNKSAVPTPFSMGAATKKKGGIEPQDSGFIDEAENYGESDNDDEDDGDDDNLDSDRMVKAKKVASSKPAASTSKDKAPTRRGGGGKSAARGKPGRGRGK